MKKLIIPAVILSVLLVFALAVYAGAQEEKAQDTQSQEKPLPDKAAELERVRVMADEVFEKVSFYSGLPIKNKVDIKIVNKAEVREYILKEMAEEYPGDELERQTASLAMLGLLPQGYDLRQGLLDLIHEQAGAFYDPRTKTFYSIIDLPEMFKIPMVEKMIVAHELTHALQDQYMDLLPFYKDVVDDADLLYARQSITEGMASVVMFSVLQNADPAKMPDIGKMMRSPMTTSMGGDAMKVFNESPLYLREMLMGPYADGASFVIAQLKAQPGSKPIDLYKRVPVSSEQVLHADKFAENDVPSDILLTKAVDLLPGDWEDFFKGTLGEIDVRVLCSQFEITRERTDAVSVGWDGIRFAVMENDGNKLMLASSAWDSSDDAGEFADALNDILTEMYGADGFSYKRQDNRVAFLIGSLESLPVDNLLDTLLSDTQPK